MAGMFGQMKPTRSCLASPAPRRAEARRLARSSNWRYVYRRSPWTTATLSGNTAALRSRKLTGVSSVRYTWLVGFIAATTSGGLECPILHGAALDHGPGGVGEGSGALAAQAGVGVVGGAGHHAAHDALGDRGQAEQREGDVEVPVGDLAAADTTAIGVDVVLLAG